MLRCDRSTTGCSPARRRSSSEAAEAYESFLTGVVTRAFESFVDDVSNWYIRRSRRRFWEESDEAAFRTLWYALVQSLRAVSPIMPFLAEHLWQALVAGAAPDAPESVFLAGWPAPNPALADDRLVERDGRGEARDRARPLCTSRRPAQAAPAPPPRRGRRGRSREAGDGRATRRGDRRRAQREGGAISPPTPARSPPRRPSPASICSARGSVPRCPELRRLLAEGDS